MRCTNRDYPFDTINRKKIVARNIARAGFEIFYTNKRSAYPTKSIDPDKKNLEEDE
jgi:hypothetical protein